MVMKAPLFRTNINWDFKKDGKTYRIVELYSEDFDEELGEDAQENQSLATVEVCNNSSEWRSDRIIKSLDDAYANNDGSLEIEYTDINGKSWGEKLPPETKLFIRQDNGKYIKIKAERKHVA